MNCFQIIIFVLRRTATNSVLKRSSGCELLSNHYLCAKKNSRSTVLHVISLVVNCFQIIIFVLRRTALPVSAHLLICCELLSNHYLCAKKNSMLLPDEVRGYVVNCFQIIIFVLRRTATLYIP